MLQNIIAIMGRDKFTNITAALLPALYMDLIFVRRVMVKKVNENGTDLWGVAVDDIALGCKDLETATTAADSLIKAVNTAKSAHVEGLGSVMEHATVNAQREIDGLSKAAQ